VPVGANTLYAGADFGLGLLLLQPVFLQKVSTAEHD
jgi:hypothetical protein